MFGYIQYFLKGGTIFVGADNMSAIFFLGWYLSSFTLIDDLYWLVDDLDFLDKDKWSLKLPGLLCICYVAVT